MIEQTSVWKMKKQKDFKNKSNIILSSLKHIFSNRAVIYTVFMVSILFLLMYIIFITEHDNNSKINTFFDAFWYTLVTITTVGYGDITPQSFIGRFAGLILLLFGVIIFAAFSGKIASILFDKQLKKDRGLIQLKKIKNHFLICGWKPDFEKILEGVITSNPDVPLEMIVLLNNGPSDQMERIKDDSRFRGINYLSGDFSDEATLLRANIKTAERALILSDKAQSYSALETDSITVLAVLTMDNLNPRMYIAAELLDSKFEKHLSLAHCDEIILSTDYERSLLVSASSGQGLSHVLRELITEVSGEGLYINDIPSDFIGKTYREYRRGLKTTAVLIGILENTGNFYQRRKEALTEAQKNPDMKKIVTNLKKVKQLKSNQPILAPSDDYIILPNSKGIFIQGHSIDNDEDQE